jgi:hypothetical protein
MSIENFSSMPNLTLNELLDEVGLVPWLTITNTFVLPTISMIGIVFCSISAKIFFMDKFADPIFFYYRVLTIVYIFGLVINIPSGILFSPRYLPNIDTYSAAVFHIYYITIWNFLIHFGDVIQICILLTRIKLFSPFVRKNFTTSPQIVSFIFLIICFLIDFPMKFSAKPVIFGEYYFLDENNKKTQSVLYSVRDSEMLPSEELLFFTIWTISNIFTLIVSVILSVVLFKKYSNYLKGRKNVDVCKLISRTIQTQSSKNHAILINYAILRENYERKMGSNMFYMISTLFFITILSRLLKTCCFVYFYLFPSFDISLRVLTANIIAYTLLPTISILVFSSFNKIFRNELKNILSFGPYDCFIRN